MFVFFTPKHLHLALNIRLFMHHVAGTLTHAASEAARFAGNGGGLG
jgi:hypothetical protein